MLTHHTLDSQGVPRLPGKDPNRAKYTEAPAQSPATPPQRRSSSGGCGLLPSVEPLGGKSGPRFEANGPAAAIADGAAASLGLSFPSCPGNLDRRASGKSTISPTRHLVLPDYVGCGDWLAGLGQAHLRMGRLQAKNVQNPRSPTATDGVTIRSRHASGPWQWGSQSGVQRGRIGRSKREEKENTRASVLTSFRTKEPQRCCHAEETTATLWEGNDACALVTTVFQACPWLFLASRT